MKTYKGHRFPPEIISYAGIAKLMGRNCQNQSMNTYKRHRVPPDIISYAVWLYYRFNLSHRDIEDLLAGYCQVKGPKLLESGDEYLQTSPISA